MRSIVFWYRIFSMVLLLLFILTSVFIFYRPKKRHH